MANGVVEKINTTLSSLDEKVNNWNTENIKNPANAFKDDLTGKITSFSNSISSKIPEKFAGSDLEKVSEILKFDIENINLRDKLKVECPDFLKHCGVSQIDFGSLFLNPKQEAFIAQGTDVANDVINTLNGIQNYLTPEAIQSAINVVTFIITDLIQQVITYCLQVFQTYVSPDFVLGLTQDMVTSSLRYTATNTQDPAKILEELMMDNSVKLELDAELSKAEKSASLMVKINDAFTNVQDGIKTMMDEIQPYTSEIAKYMQYGPDYACRELEALYKKYLNMGISYVNTQLGILNSTIDDWVDSQAEAVGKFAAEKINKMQERSLDKIKKTTDVKLQQVKIKAFALINKAIMNLMAMLGG